MCNKKNIFFIATTILSVIFIWTFENSSTLSFIFPFLIAACLSVNFLYCGKTYSVISLCIACLFSYFALNNSISVMISSLIIATIGIVIGYLISKNKKQPVIIGTAATGYLILYIVSLVILSYALGENAIKYTVNLLKPYLMETLEASLYSMRMEGMYSNIEEYLELFLESLIMLMPAIIIVLSAIMGYIMVWVISVSLKLIKSNYKLEILFSKFKADGIMITIYFLSMLASMFINNEMFALVFNNIYTILQFVLQVCGLSLIDAYFINKKLAFVPRIIVIMIIFFASMLPVVAAVLVVLAAVDANRDFRGLNKKQTPD